MSAPRIEIDLGKVIHNAQQLTTLYNSKRIEVIAVTKAICGNPTIAHALVKSGIEILADSRISNIKRMKRAKVPAQFLLLRIPMLSEVREVIKYADFSFNSEISVIKKLSEFAVSLNIIHKIILMVELGDLREGVLPVNLENTIKEILKLKGVELVGIGTNLTCYGGVKPDENNMGTLSAIADSIENKFQLRLKFVSGGNSANYDWFTSTTDVQRINNIRLGESIYLGCETLYRKPIPDLFTNAFTLITEVIESKMKPSLPYGEICQDATGVIPEFQDQGLMRRAILGIGLQDVVVSGLTPLLDIDIIGASSDHLIVNAKESDIKVGKEVAFHLNYAALISAMISPYVLKKMVNV